MKRIVCVCICFCCLMVGIFSPLSVYGAGKSYMAGITLDLCNRYYSVKDIKKYVSLASKSKAGYVQLHFSGDANLGIECKYLKQNAKKKYIKNKDEYYNPKTKKSFLSKKQVEQILKFAKSKHVEIVPEIDMPGHMGGFEKLYVKAYGKTKAKKIFSDEYGWELRIKDKEAIKFAKKIYGEYAKLFKDCKYFHMGCDEFWSGSSSANKKYINTISRYLEQKGFEVWAWNDLFLKKNMKSINHNIRVCYWSFDGDSEDLAEQKERRKTRASFPDLQKEGFRLLNYNSYYLYFCPTKENVNQSDIDYMKNDAKKNWSLKTWDGNRNKQCKNLKNISGACVSVWGEDSKGVKNKQIYNGLKPLYEVVLKKCG